MTAHNSVRVTFNIMLAKIAVLLGSVALVAAGSSLTSVSNLHGGSYSYGVDHDNYGAWYGTAYPHSHGGLALGHEVGGLYGHGALTHGAVSHGALGHGDVSYGYETYGAGFGYGDYGHATSYQNYNLKSIGGQKILHTDHGVNHGHGATSYQSIYQKTGSGLYGGYGGDYDYSHGNYAGGYGHGSYAGGISSQNFNLKSYAHQPISYVHQPISHVHQPISHVHQSISHVHQPISHVHQPISDDVSSKYILGYHTPNYGHETLGNIGYSHGYDSYGHELDYSNIHIPTYGNLHDLGNYGYSAYGPSHSGISYGYSGYGQDFSGYGQGFSGYGHGYLPSYGGLTYY